MIAWARRRPEASQIHVECNIKQDFICLSTQDFRHSFLIGKTVAENGPFNYQVAERKMSHHNKQSIPPVAMDKIDTFIQ